MSGGCHSAFLAVTARPSIFRRLLKQVLDGLSTDQQNCSTGNQAPAASSLASDSALQLALLSCSCELVSFFLVESQQLFPAAWQRMGSSQYMMEMWEAVQLFIKHSTCSEKNTAPSAVIHYLAFMRMRILEEFAFAPGSTVFDAMLSSPDPVQKLQTQVRTWLAFALNLQLPVSVAGTS